ncbi:MAG: hypothetical protein E7435_06515 [Ruminococcaceae bacterium]|nr:hypothetical protein [Oscillospiraceae bacterium]
MNSIRIHDITMKQPGLTLSFKEKLELCKLLDRLGVSVIALEPIENIKIDSLLIKSVSSAVKESAICVPVALNAQSVETTWQALKNAKVPRLQVCAPVSTVQMEYLFHKKPEAMLSAIDATIRACKANCRDVEFVADDATRSDLSFLCKALETAILAGATTVTVRDAAGAMLPEEFSAFLADVKANTPGIQTVALGVSCSNELALADACTVSALKAGAAEVSAAAYPICTASTANIASILAVKGSSMGLSCPVRTTQLQRTTEQISRICQSGKGVATPFGSAPQDTDSLFLTAHDDISAVMQAAAKLGYDLSEEDAASVYAAFTRIAAKKEQVSARELDAIVAAAAMQVPPTYKLQSYVITAASATSATAHMTLTKEEKTLEGVSLGDGAIDAAFHALEQITGHHYELDDFQIQAVTEGREAMGQTVVKLRSGGKVYSGKGISTDIVGASIHAYLNALNKIVYEEDAV